MPSTSEVESLSEKQEGNAEPIDSPQKSPRDVGSRMSEGRLDISRNQSIIGGGSGQRSTTPFSNVPELPALKTSRLQLSAASSQLSEGGLGKALGIAKRTRQQANYEASLLESRLALLQIEEENSRRKIFAAKKQTQQKITMKRLNEVQQEEKQKKYIEEAERVRHLLKANKQQKEVSLKDKQQVFQEYAEAKRSNYREVRQDRAENELSARLYKESVWEERQKRRIEVQQQEMQGSLSINTYRNCLTERYLVNYRQEIAEEEKARQAKLKEISDLEKREIDLIRKLHVTQSMQKLAVEELKAATIMPPSEFNSAYKPILSKKQLEAMLANANGSQQNSIMGEETQRSRDDGTVNSQVSLPGICEKFNKRDSMSFQSHTTTNQRYQVDDTKTDPYLVSPSKRNIEVKHNNRSESGEKKTKKKGKKGKKIQIILKDFIF